MPLSSITTGGGGPGILDFAALLTGNTAKQREQSKLDSFINDELPSIANDIHGATTAADVQRHAQRFIAGGLKAGINAQQLDKLGEMLVQPALNNLAGGELEKFGSQFRPQTKVTEKPVNLPAIEGPFGPGLEKSNLTAPELTTTPGRSFSPADAFTLSAIQARTGVKLPQGLSSLIATPSAIAENEGQAAAANRLASQRKVQAAMDARKLDVLENLPDTAVGDSGITTRQLGLATSGSGLTSMIPQRQKAETPIDIELKKSQIARNQATTARTKAAGNVGEMKPAQLIQLRNSVRSQLKAAQDSFDDEETASLQAQLGMIDSEIQKKGKVLFRPDETAKPKVGKTGGKPTVQSVKQKFGIR